VIKCEVTVAVGPMATPTRQASLRQQHHHQRKKGSVSSASGKEGPEGEAEPDRENLW
jgi:hypothetical protein